ncbi:putative zinc-finger of nitric oxide synthase-interacting protein [Lyophyllum shimeji]|uniref:Zinc-finger of nitric oxide synthase-interacting protein n=1 Tax=Lyophyllum shimeji TaxID=47721 RepID=A0A9P3PQF6_LYOSH|nr:putative zinc-finger of nitric oxide synthase-interacting protein [Lyophyllum shimeji]
MTCNEGHLFCKECVYTDLLSQKKDIQRQKNKLEALKLEAEEEKARAKEAARERVLRDFEKGQLGLAGGPSASGAKSRSDADESRGTKRKFAFDASTVETLAQEAEEAALRQIEREQAEALRSKLPDFWLPSLTPTYTSSGPPQSLMDVKVQTTCRGGQPTHPIALKHLIPVKFTYFNASTGSSRSTDSTPADIGEKIRKEEAESMCPSCKKHLSNSVLMFVMKPCGHVTSEGERRRGVEERRDRANLWHADSHFGKSEIASLNLHFYFLTRTGHVRQRFLLHACIALNFLHYRELPISTRVTQPGLLVSAIVWLETRNLVVEGTSEGLMDATSHFRWILPSNQHLHCSIHTPVLLHSHLPWLATACIYVP